MGPARDGSSECAVSDSLGPGLAALVGLCESGAWLLQSFVLSQIVQDNPRTGIMLVQQSVVTETLPSKTLTTCFGCDDEACDQ